MLPKKTNLNKDFYEYNFLKVYDTNLSLLWEYKTHGRIFVDCEDGNVLVASSDNISKRNAENCKIFWSRNFEKYVKIDDCWLDKDRIVINYIKGSLKTYKLIYIKENEYYEEIVKVANLSEIKNDIHCDLTDPVTIYLEIIDFNNGKTILEKTYKDKVNCYFNRDYLFIDDNEKVSSDDSKELWLNIHNLQYSTKDKTTYTMHESFLIGNDIFYGGYNLFDEDFIFFNITQEIKPFMEYWNTNNSIISASTRYI